MKAAGILFLSKAGNALFLRRSSTAIDFPGCWDFPGGGAENGETAEEAATREAREEIGDVPAGTLILHTRTKGSVPYGTAGPGAPGNGLLPVNGAPATPPQPPAQPAALPPDHDFTTFLQRVDEEFIPTLDTEHDGWAWAPVATPPEPLHPGCRIALERLTMDELGVARAIAEGRLTSPQRYENVTLWAIRITGTGGAYRPKHDEFVIRKPEDHLTPDALARLNGLPVIFKHPPKNLLDSEEFGARVVGTIFLPYVAGDEAWGIAKIFDDAVNRALEDGSYSTSPGVNFRDFSVNARLALEDGSKVLLEGKPSLFDHIAICELGVWDKDGEPAGIRSESREDSAMTEDEKKAADEAKAKDDAARKDAEDKEKKDKEEKDREDAKRADADAGTALSKIADAVKGIADSVAGLGKRMDAFEEEEKKREDARRADGKRKDDFPDKDDKDKDAAEKAAADKKRKDDAEEEKKREDKAKADARADEADIRKRVAEVERMVKETDSKVKPLSDDDHHLLADSWSRADDVFPSLGKQTPRPMPGETSMQFRRRVAKLLKEHSPTWKAIDLGSAAFADDAAFAIVEGQILAEAAKVARDPMAVPTGQLRMVERKRDGHIVREFVGEPRTWMNPMAGPVQLRAEGKFDHSGLGQR